MKYKIERGRPGKVNKRHNKSKYGELFAQLAPGVCIPFDTVAEMKRVHASVARLIKQEGKPWRLVMRRNCPDGKSRFYVEAL